MGVPGSVDAAQDAVPRAVRELAADLLTDVPRLTRELTDHFFATVPELSAVHDDALRAETLASTEANLDQAMRMLRRGGHVDSLVLPPEAAEYVCSLVRRGISLPPLLRTYRLGHAWLWDVWSRALQERIADADELHTAQEQSSAFMFAYVDRISDLLVAEYATERRRAMRGAEQLRAGTVRAILAGEPLDEEVAAGRLGYRLRRHHVALRVSSCATEVRGLERAAREAAAALGTGEPLVVHSGAASLDVWCGAFGAPDTDALESYAPPDGIRVAAGTPGEGVAGFRRSHAEAVNAARTAALAGEAARAVTTYRSVELVSLLAADLPRARAFVARHLGPLASTEEPVARLRDTVFAFLAAGGSSTRVAKDLHVHQNTVAYRVKRAEELLGRRVTDGAVELTCALALAAALGPVVLTEASAQERE